MTRELPLNSFSAKNGACDERRMRATASSFDVEWQNASGTRRSHLFVDAELAALWQQSSRFQC
jgi:hypothetical protein